MQLSTRHLRIIAPLIFFFTPLSAQPFTATGRVMMDSFVVRNASVTFIDVSDTNRRVETRTDSLGNFRVSIPTGVLSTNPTTPQSFTLGQNYPNPFSFITEIPYTLERPSPVEVRIYDLLGKLVKSCQVGTQGAGPFGVRWDGRNESGLRMARGIYFYQVRAGNEIQTRKMLLMDTQGGAVLSGSLVHAPRAYRRSSSQTGERTYRVRVANESTTRPKVQLSDTTISISDGMDVTLHVPESLDSYALCYVRQDTVGRPNWEIYISNLTGTNRKNITNYQGDDEYPAWSPDGRYIAFSRGTGLTGTGVYVHDLQTGITTHVTSDGGGAGQMPNWAPNGQLCISYQRPLSATPSVYLTSPDGTNKRRILDHAAGIYLYSDSYTFLFVNGSQIFKTNADGGFLDFILELKPSTEQFITVRDHDPTVGELLVNTNVFSGSQSALAIFSAETKQFRLVLASDDPYAFGLQRFSNDYKRVVFVEYNTNGYNEEFLSLVESGRRTRLLRLPGQLGGEWFGSSPMHFSADNRYVVFDKHVRTGTIGFVWTTRLQIVDITAASIEDIGSGMFPSWNPLW